MLQRKTPVSLRPARIHDTRDPVSLGFAVPASLAFLVQASAGISIRAVDGAAASRWYRALLPHFLGNARLRVHLEHQMLAELTASMRWKQSKIVMSCAISHMKTLQLNGSLDAETTPEVPNQHLYAQGFIPVSISLQSWHVTDHASKAQPWQAGRLVS